MVKAKARHSKVKYYTVIQDGENVGTVIAINRKSALKKTKKIGSNVKIYQTDERGHITRPKNRRYR